MAPTTRQRSPKRQIMPASPGARPSGIVKAATPTTAPRQRKLSVMSLDGSEAELLAIEQEGAIDATAAGAFHGARPDGRAARTARTRTARTRAEQRAKQVLRFAIKS